MDAFSASEKVAPLIEEKESKEAALMVKKHGKMSNKENFMV